jgi:esterase/lipase superfamily enzyme
MGQMEKPSVFKLEFTEDPAKHIIILSVSTMREAYFLESVDMMAGKTTDQDALVFIHGYNVTFAEAVRRTAQIAFDLDFRGIPICYSWPSAANYAGYMADETSIDWTTPHLVEFLRKVIQLKNLKTVHLIAHSMGNRALVNCLSRMAAEFQQGGRAQLRQTILAAPDIDAGVFQQLAESFTKAAARTTLYASSKDLALQVSQQFHRYPRAGESGPAILVLPSIDTVDVSEVPSGFLGHSYYGGARSVLSDVYELIQSGAAPPRFGLRQSTGKNGIYWMFVP